MTLNISHYLLCFPILGPLGCRNWPVGCNSLTAASASAEQELMAEVSWLVFWVAWVLSELPELPGTLSPKSFST